MIDRFYSPGQLKVMSTLSRGAYKFGKDVKIASNTIIDCKELEVGNNTIISDYTILTGKIKIGNHCHIAHKVHLSGHYNISIADHCTIGANTTIYTESDDHKSQALIGPQIPEKYRSCYRGSVNLSNFCAIGSYCIIMPGTIMMEGSMLRIRSNLIGQQTSAWAEYESRTPTARAEFIRQRDRTQLALASEFKEWYTQSQK